MRKLLSVVFILPFLLVGCASMNEKQISGDRYGPTYIELDNGLPPSIKHIVDVDTFASIVSNEPVRFPTYLSIEISGDQIISTVAFDIEGTDTSAICYGDILSLGAVERYMDYLNQWLFSKESEWDVNLSAAMSRYRYLYIVEFQCENIRLQIQGRFIQGAYGREHLEIQSPIYLKVPLQEEMRLAKIELSANGIHYIDLDPCYDPITKAYYPTYFVYKLFNRQDVLQNIPKP